MSSPDVLAQLREGGKSTHSRAPHQVLVELARTGEALAAAEQPQPEVQLYLAGGAVIRGHLVSVVDERGGAIALVAVGGSPWVPAVAFVRIDQLIAVTVVDASLLVRGAASHAPAPGKLELARQLASQAELVATALGRTLPIRIAGELDDDGRRAVATLAPMLAEVLRAIAGDAMGQDALRPLEVIELGAAASGEVLRPAPHLLVVRAPRLPTPPFTSAALRTEIERVL